MRSLVVAILLIGASAVLLQFRDEHSYQSGYAVSAVRSQQPPQSGLRPGGSPASEDPAPTVYSGQLHGGYDVSHGKQLYGWFNCTGCHANGGGGIGPALMDGKWKYGGEPQDIYASIVEGRPDGMPSYAGKLTEQQAWQVVAYVRSMSAMVPIHALPGRRDDIQSKPPETMTPQQPPQQDLEGGQKP